MSLEKVDNKEKTLLAFTTANQIDYNIKGIESILKNKLGNVDLVVFDDASNDGTIEWCKENDVEIITKKSAKGLTHSWNLAYQKFKSEDYKFLIFSNSDIIVPKGSLEIILKENEKFIIVSPLSTKKGVGHQPEQDFRKYFNPEIDEYKFENTERVQEFINENKSIEGCKEVDYINGFFFSVNRDIISYEYSETELFDPKNPNCGNEQELCERVPHPKGIVLNAYIFHFKGVSLEVTNIDNQSYEFNIYRDLNWQEAEKIQNSAIRKLIFKIKYKFRVYFSN